MATWTAAQLGEVLAGAEDDPLSAAYVLIATTGMRRGEAMGLRWQDVDLDAGFVRIRQTLTTVSDQLALRESALGPVPARVRGGRCGCGRTNAAGRPEVVAGERASLAHLQVRSATAPSDPELSGWDLDARVYECRHRESVGSEEARRRSMETLIADLQATGKATTVYIERREGADDRDRATIIRVRRRMPPLEFHHLRPPDDPLLWLPDCIAWAVGAGGEWQQVLAGTVDLINVG